MSIQQAYEAGGLSEGSASLMPQAVADRAEGRARAEESRQRQRIAEATAPTEADLKTMAATQSAELQRLQSEALNARRRSNEQLTYSALERYDADNDMRHLNVMLEDLRTANSSILGDVVRMDALTEQDRALMTQAGMVNIEEILNDPDVAHSYAKVTLSDGSTEIRSIDELKRMTRYNMYANDQELQRQTQEQMITRMRALGFEPNQIGQEAFRRASMQLDPTDPSFNKLYSQTYDHLSTINQRNIRVSDPFTRSETMREVTMRMLEQHPDLERGTPEYAAEFNKIMDEVIERKARTSQVKNIAAAEEARQSLDEEFDGDFLSSDMTDPRNRGRASARIAQMEQGFKTELGEGEKKLARQVRQLTALGAAAGEMPESATGLIDRVFFDVSKYITNEVSGVRQTAAYAAYRNIARNALFGATLPTGEMRSFVQQFGNTYQQQKPILDALVQNLEAVRTDYESIMQMNDPYIAHYYLGPAGVNLEDAIFGIEDTIEQLESFRPAGEVISEPQATTTTPIELVPVPGVSPESQSKLDRIMQ